MARQVIKVSSLDGQQVRISARRKKRGDIKVSKAIQGKTFGDLNDQEKGKLLKALAIKAGLITPDP